jgi:hypothetical protein
VINRKVAIILIVMCVSGIALWALRRQAGTPMNSSRPSQPILILPASVQKILISLPGFNKKWVEMPQDEYSSLAQILNESALWDRTELYRGPSVPSAPVPGHSLHLRLITDGKREIQLDILGYYLVQYNGEIFRVKAKNEAQLRTLIDGIIEKLSR